MTKPYTRAMLKREVAKVAGLTESHEDFPLAFVMLAGALVGPKPLALVAMTGLPRRKVEQLVRRLRAAKIFGKEKVHGGEWFGKDGGIAFNLDIAVAKGWLRKVTA